MVTCGRICLETEGRLDAHNVVLEARAGPGIGLAAAKNRAALKAKKADANRDENTSSATTNDNNNNNDDDEEFVDDDDALLAEAEADEGLGQMTRVRLAIHDIKQSYTLFPGQVRNKFHFF